MTEKLKNKYVDLFMKYGTIEIKCQGADELPLDAIMDFQLGLKKRSQENKIKLATQMFSKGFIAPFFIWKKDENTYYNLDGHGRSEVLCDIRQLKIEIPEIYPVAYIEAKDEADAREKLLAISSQYGQWDPLQLDDWKADIDEEINKCFRFLDGEINEKKPECKMNGCQIILKFQNKEDLKRYMNDFAADFKLTKKEPIDRNSYTLRYIE